jgi:hypothetical protein
VAAVHGGCPGTWEILPSPYERPGRKGCREKRALACGRHCPAHRGSEARGQRTVPPSEGNEARREGRQEVVAPW